MTEVSMIKATCGGCFIKASDTEKQSQLPVIMARKISQDPTWRSYWDSARRAGREGLEIEALLVTFCFRSWCRRVVPEAPEVAKGPRPIANEVSFFSLRSSAFDSSLLRQKISKCSRQILIESYSLGPTIRPDEISPKTPDLGVFCMQSDKI
jgi:hypothetical protein